MLPIGRPESVCSTGSLVGSWPSNTGHALAAIRRPAGFGSSAIRTSVRTASKLNSGRVCGSLGEPIGTGLPPSSLAQSGGSRAEPDISLLVIARELAARLPQRPSPEAARSAA